VTTPSTTDPGCSSPSDVDEKCSGPGCPQCDNTIDDDSDATTDYYANGTGDPGCANAADTDEHGTAVCDDGIDNDLDGTTDYQIVNLVQAGDLGCSSLSDTSERGTSICDDGLDNDDDGRIDFSTDVNANDPGCSGPTDTNEKCNVGAGCPQCDDTSDNDNDGKIDYNTDSSVSDPGCTGPTDATERGGSLVCDNDLDDDNDSTKDFRLDGTGDVCCLSLQTPTEACACATKIGGGTEHTCVIKGSQLVWCWGDNANGQLGNNSTTDSSTPVAVTATNLTGALQVAGGDRHTCARKSDNTVWCWGKNDVGQLGDGTTMQRLTPAAVTATNLSSASDVATGLNHSCAVRTSDGTVWCWGKNDAGQLGDGTMTSSSNPVQVVGLSGMAQVVAGEQHTCARKSSDGTVYCWGRNNLGQLSNKTNTDSLTPVQVLKLKGSSMTQPVTSVAMLASGRNFVCGLLTTGSIACWGEGTQGQLGNGASTNVILAVTVNTINDGVLLTAGHDHACAKRGGGSEMCWGDNTNGQLGNNMTTDSNVPVTVSNLSGINAIGNGGTHSCALTSSVTVECWGANGQGQIGDGTTVEKHVPTAATLTCP
jgi:alpha-tubulin suppressor-like RCC1 family protein